MNPAGGLYELEYLLSVESHSRERVKPTKHKVHALALVSGVRFETCGVDPGLAMDPLQACLVLADEGIWNNFGRQQIEVYAT